MIYINSSSTEAAYYFALEEYLMTRKKLRDTVFMFWHTFPTVMIGSGQVAQNEINKDYVEKTGLHLFVVKAAEVLYIPMKAHGNLLIFFREQVRLCLNLKKPVKTY